MNFSLWDDIFKRDPNNDKFFLMEMILRRKKNGIFGKWSTTHTYLKTTCKTCFNFWECFCKLFQKIFLKENVDQAIWCRKMGFKILVKKTHCKIIIKITKVITTC